jgi:hypothetical protein
MSLIEAFPEKRESIMNVPIFTEIDGKPVRVSLGLED